MSDKRDVLRFRDHLDVGGPVGSIYLAIGRTAGDDSYEFDYRAMTDALTYLWRHTYSPWVIELEDGMRLTACGATHVDENGWPIPSEDNDE